MSKLLDRLNPSQREAVMHETGPLLIIAGPGSGKTRTVVHSIAYAIENREVVPGRIVAFTFTNKAINELKDRLSKIVSPDIAKDVWISIPVSRRELHRQNPQKNGIRSRYGGTLLAQGLVKNTLVKHVKHGLTRLAGINAKGLFSMDSLDGKRITTGAKRQDFKVRTRLNFNYRSGFPPQPKEWGLQSEE